VKDYIQSGMGKDIVDPDKAESMEVKGGALVLSWELVACHH